MCFCDRLLVTKCLKIRILQEGLAPWKQPLKALTCVSRHFHGTVIQGKQHMPGQMIYHLLLRLVFKYCSKSCSTTLLFAVGLTPTCWGISLLLQYFCLRVHIECKNWSICQCRARFIHLYIFQSFFRFKKKGVKRFVWLKSDILFST